MGTPSRADQALTTLLRGDKNYNLPSDRPTYLPYISPNYTGQVLRTTNSFSIYIPKNGNPKQPLQGSELINELNRRYDTQKVQLNSVTGNDPNSIAYRAQIQANMNANTQATKQIGGQQALNAGQAVIGALSSGYVAGLNTQYMVNTSNQAYINTKLRPNLVGSARIPMPKNSMGGWHVKGQTTSNANVPTMRNITNVTTVVSTKTNSPPQPKFLRGTTPTTSNTNTPNSANNPNNINNLRQRINNFLNIFKNCP